MNTACDRIARLIRDRRGALLATTALALPVIAGFAGLGVEVGMWYSDKRDLQTAADAAALSGAFERVRGNPNGLQSAARHEAQRNGFQIGGPNTIAVNNPPLSGSRAGETTAVEVVLTRPHRLLFSTLLLSDDMTIAARSTAAVDTTGEACVLALDRTANRALNNQGSSTVLMDGCVMASNSIAPDAIYLGGSTTVNAFSLWTSGGLVNGGSGNVTLARPATTHAWDLDDPLADFDMGAVPACSPNPPYETRYGSGARTIEPGVYCGELKFNAGADITMKPGRYYVADGDFHVNGSARVRCDCPNPEDGVTIILTKKNTSTIGRVDIRAGADVQLRAPSDPTNPFRGVLFYQDRTAPVNTTGVHQFNGGATMRLEGSIYMPQQGVEFSGNNSASKTCTQIIARTVSFTGNAYIDNTACQAAGVQPVTVTQARLVE
ncbi:MAG TPA: pilus assembly protein TadG-related protein [Alphaproteobacteria bacterium]|nr:pilus assembly protein TadG-related protein [Alphaproteobacteria bacterium]